MKVQRPGIGERIALDMVLLRRFIGQVDRFLPGLLPDGFQVGASWSRDFLLPSRIFHFPWGKSVFQSTGACLSVCVWAHMASCA